MHHLLMSTMQHFSQTFGTLSDTNGVFPFHLLMLAKAVYYGDLGIEVGIGKIIRYKVSPVTQTIYQTTSWWKPVLRIRLYLARYNLSNKTIRTNSTMFFVCLFFNQNEADACNLVLI